MRRPPVIRSLRPTRAGAPRRRCGPLLPVCAAALLVACASAPREEPRPLPSPHVVDGSELSAYHGSPGLGPLTEALEARNHDALYARVLQVLERCGTRPLGQQALLLLAVGELDPRNPDPRPSLALESTELVLRGAEPGSWMRPLAESLYLIARRLGAEKAGTYAADESELRFRSEKGNDGSSKEPPVACEAAPWPEAGGGVDPPAFRERSYPARVAQLRRKVAELEEELERLRRITKEP